MAKRKTGTRVNHHQLSVPSVTSPSKISSILWYLAVIPTFWSFGFTTMWGSRTPSDQHHIWLASVLACLFNPNGIRAFTYPIRYAFDSSSPFAHR